MTAMTLPDAATPAGDSAQGPAAPARPVHPARFTGAGGDYWRLLIRGALRMAITLGIYRFWLNTDIRRFLWSHSEIEGDPLEYTGTAVELLIGFLIAMTVVVPLNVLFFAAALGLLGEWATAVGFLLLLLLGQFAVFRARRYRLSRTVLRGVRFHQSGSAWSYAFKAMGWTALIALTLGLAYPFAAASLERYKMRHSHYGDLDGRFEGSGWRLFVRGIWMWAVALLPTIMAVYGAVTWIDWSALIGAASMAENPAEFFGMLGPDEVGKFYILGWALGMSIAWTILAAILLLPVFQALVLRWWIAGVRFEGIAFDSWLRTGPVYRAYLKFILLALLILAATAILAGIGFVTLRFGLAAYAQETREIVIAVAGVLFYTVVALGLSTVYQGTVKLALWRGGVDTLEADGLDALDRVKAEGRAGSAVGEGLADALDVGGL